MTIFVITRLIYDINTNQRYYMQPKIKYPPNQHWPELNRLLSVKQISKALGMAPMTVYRYMTGWCRPPEGFEERVDGLLQRLRESKEEDQDQ